MYLGTNISHKNNIHNEIKFRISSQTEDVTQYAKCSYQNSFKNKILRKIFRSMSNPKTGVYKMRKSADIIRLYNAPNFQYFLRSKILEWAR